MSEVSRYRGFGQKSGQIDRDAETGSVGANQSSQTVSLHYLDFSF